MNVCMDRGRPSESNLGTIVGILPGRRVRRNRRRGELSRDVSGVTLDYVLETSQCRNKKSHHRLFLLLDKHTICQDASEN